MVAFYQDPSEKTHLLEVVVCVVLDVVLMALVLLLEELIQGDRAVNWRGFGIFIHRDNKCIGYLSTQHWRSVRSSLRIIFWGAEHYKFCLSAFLRDLHIFFQAV